MVDEDWRDFVQRSAVKPLNVKPRANTHKPKLKAPAKNFKTDEWRALLESREPNERHQRDARGDEFEFLAATEPRATLNKLRGGKIPITDSIDLHGLSLTAAEKRVNEFIAHSLKHHNLCVRIIHGKGHGSFARRSVIKDDLPLWLSKMRCVVAFCTAPHNDGGSGATYVLLR